MRILFLGDIVGRPGRCAVERLLSDVQQKYQSDLVIANGENAAGGNGITEKIADQLFSAGIDVLTMGNHVWDRKEVFDFIDHEDRIIRPANYPPSTPGLGWTLATAHNGVRVGIINISGRVFMPPLDCPFRTIEAILPLITAETNVVIVDFHAEATSEKMAMGWYLDGRASLVVGTHTHIQTADERILPHGTGYITDAGMTGPYDSVLGVETKLVLDKFLTQLPVRFEVAEGTMQLNGLYCDIDQKTGNTRDIERIKVIREA